MEAGIWQQVEELFHKALELDPGERSSLLRDAGEPVRREVAAMLEAYEAAERADAEVPAARQDQSAPSAVGRKLGAYRIEREIAHGGMGTVYLASRDDDEFEQKAAIKIIRPGFAGEEITRRFRTERQILAELDHPNIARLLDGGSTPEGQPFLVMEYIDGVDLLDHCHANNLGLEQRLRLFLKICAGVAYAHRHLVIHRDLKPGNILVTADGEPKLLDFGIAKLTSTDRDATATGLGFFSPLYASPEQLNGDPVTTSTDIYSLGVLLYEMLCGRRPYRLQTTSNAELVAAILLQEPERPGSHKVLPADADAIVLKALRKEPQARYASVEQFAADIERFIEKRPVEARRGAWPYRARKFLQRNKLTAAAGALAAMAIAGGVTSTLFQARRAERRFQEVRQLANYLVFDFQDEVKKLAGSTQLQKDVVERSMHYLDRLSSESADDTGLQLDLAEAYLKLGNVLGNPHAANLGDTPQAIESFRKSIAAADRVLEAEPGNLRAVDVAADARMQLGSTNAFGGSRTASLPILREGAEMQRKRAEALPGDAEAQLKYASALASLVTVLGQSGGFELDMAPEALAKLDTLAAHLDGALRNHPGHPKLLREKGDALTRRANLMGTRDPSKAMAYSKEALATFDMITGPESKDRVFLQNRAGLLQSMAWAEAQAGHYDDALAHYEEAYGILQPMAAADSSNVFPTYKLTSVHRGRGIAYEYAKRYEPAIADFLRAAEIHRQLAEKDPSNLVYPTLRGELLSRVGRIEHEMGRMGPARMHASQGVATLVAVAKNPKANVGQLLEACKALVGSPVPGVADPRRGLAFCEQAERTGKSNNSYTYELLGSARYRVGDRAGAIAAQEKALALTPEPKPGEKPSRSRESIEMGLAAMRAGKPLD